MWNLFKYENNYPNHKENRFFVKWTTQNLIFLLCEYHYSFSSFQSHSARHCLFKHTYLQYVKVTVRQSNEFRSKSSIFHLRDSPVPHRQICDGQNFPAQHQFQNPQLRCYSQPTVLYSLSLLYPPTPPVCEIVCWIVITKFSLAAIFRTKIPGTHFIHVTTLLLTWPEWQKWMRPSCLHWETSSLDHILEWKAGQWNQWPKWYLCRTDWNLIETDVIKTIWIYLYLWMQEHGTLCISAWKTRAKSYKLNINYNKKAGGLWYS